MSEMRGVKGTISLTWRVCPGRGYLLEEVRPLLLDCPPRDQKKPGVCSPPFPHPNTRRNRSRNLRRNILLFLNYAHAMV